ncbi:MAG: hypothetical protein IPF48_12330 [Sphingomonadales bacterium]|nr:hypothetical protein [Sphingomonadales bacterium]
MKKGFILLLSILVFVTLLPFHQALAQDSAWSDVVDSNGNILYDQMSDQGVVTQAADWMPSITLPIVGTVSVPAEYHSYVTASGNTVLMPTASTLFFMAANANESGYLAAASTMGINGPGVGVDAPTGIAGIGSVFGSLLGNSGSAEMMSTINQAGFNGPSAPQDFFQAIVNGQTDIWSIAPAGLWNFLASFYTSMQRWQLIYLYAALYTRPMRFHSGRLFCCSTGSTHCHSTDSTAFEYRNSSSANHMPRFECSTGSHLCQCQSGCSVISIGSGTRP